MLSHGTQRSLVPRKFLFQAIGEPLPGQPQLFCGFFLTFVPRELLDVLDREQVPPDCGPFTIASVSRYRAETCAKSRSAGSSASESRSSERKGLIFDRRRPRLRTGACRTVAARTPRGIAPGPSANCRRRKTSTSCVPSRLRICTRDEAS